MKTLVRILLILLLVLVILVAAVAGFAAADAYAFASGSEYHNLNQSETLNGYVAQPEEAQGVGVLLLHEWWGLTEDMVRKADFLAAQGYVVVVPDLYRGRLAKTVPGAILLRIVTPQEQTLEVASAAYEFLNERVDHGTGVVGFCFGGTQAMELGRRTPSIASTVIFYGSGLITSEDEVEHLGAGGPVLGIFGAEDASIPLTEVEAFEQALAEAGVNHEVSVYEGVGHAFVEYSELNDGGPAQEAWEEMIAFLEETLMPDSAEGE